MVPIFECVFLILKVAGMALHGTTKYDNVVPIKQSFLLPHSMAMKNTVRTCANGILRPLAPTDAFMPLVGTRDNLHAEGTRFALRRLAVHDAVDAVGCR